MSSRFIPVVACVRISFLRLNNILLYIDSTFSLSFIVCAVYNTIEYAVHLSIDIWVFYLLTIVNVFWVYNRSGIAGS